MAFKRLTAEELNKAAENCDPQAMYIKGRNLIYGVNAERDPRLGVDYISTAAALGNAKAQIELGELYLKGWIVQMDLEEGFKWIKEAADQGSPKAIWLLSECFREGKGVECNRPLAFTLCRTAAKKGYLPAINGLGDYYRSDEDYRKAADCYRKAAEKGHVEAQYSLGLLYLDGKGIKQSDRKAFRWFSRAAEGHKLEAYEQTIWMLMNGIGAEKDIPAAIRMCERAYKDCAYRPLRYLLDIYQREPGYTDGTKALIWAHRIIGDRAGPALDAVAEIYSKGIITPIDPEMELSVLELGSQLNNAFCKYRLARFIEDHDTEYNKGMAMKLTIEAAEAGIPDAQYAAYQGLRDTNPDEAAYWMRMAAIYGDVHAMMSLANEYEMGEIIYKSSEMAIRWYGKAYDAGEYMAKEELDKLLYESDPFEEPDYNDIDIEKQMAVEDGDISAYCYVGDHYLKEGSPDFDIETGVWWYVRGANLGDAECKDRLAFIMYYGLAGESDVYSAVGYGTEAAYHGCKSSQYILGMCYLKGTGVEKDLEKARMWLGRAADKGHVEARKMLDSLQPTEKECMEGLAALFA